MVGKRHNSVENIPLLRVAQIFVIQFGFVECVELKLVVG